MQRPSIFLIFVLILFLNSCGRSPQRNHRKPSNAPMPVEYNDRIGAEKNRDQKNIIKMEKVGGVFQIPVEVNGVKMSFIFDTGASSISISKTEALFLIKQGLLKEEDVIGKQNFIDAKGEISEGTVIMLRSIKIGNKTLKNVEASVVDNLNAPLLLGQSALGRFGKISIDNVKGELILE